MNFSRIVHARMRGLSCVSIVDFLRIAYLSGAGGWPLDAASAERVDCKRRACFYQSNEVLQAQSRRPFNGINRARMDRFRGKLA